MVKVRSKKPSNQKASKTSKNLPGEVHEEVAPTAPVSISDITGVLSQKTENIVKDILAEDDIEQTKSLVSMFNLMMRKKNALRVLKLNSLLDSATSTMMERFEKRPDEFSTKDLNDCIKTIQSVLDSANSSLELVDEAPAISLNQQTNNTLIIAGSDSDSALNRDSRDRVLDVVRLILSQAQTNESSQQTSEDVDNGRVITVEAISEEQSATDTINEVQGQIEAPTNNGEQSDLITSATLLNEEDDTI